MSFPVLGPLDERIDQSLESIRKQWERRPIVGIVLGTGLGEFRGELDTEYDIAYSQIPHFPQTTAMSHAGRLLLGTIGGLPAAILDGRIHRYEGYSIEQITYPIRILQRMGVRWLLFTNASGGLRPGLEIGDILVIEDHIRLTKAILLSRPDQGTYSCAGFYDRNLVSLAVQAARHHGFQAQRGVYATMLGPTYETRAEYRFLRMIGADVVGMSTVPEVLTAVACGMQVLALSVVTNVCQPDRPNVTDGQSVVSAASDAEWKVRAILLGVLNSLSSSPVL